MQNWIENLRRPYSGTKIELGMYPVVKRNLKPVFEYSKSGKCVARVFVTKQDNIYVGSFTCQVGIGSVGDGGRSFLPGRKWGEFNSLQDTDLYYSSELLEYLKGKNEYSKRHKRLTNPAIKLLLRHIENIPIQLELFS